MVDNREFFIIPCMNADGWEYNRSTNPNGGGGWRKKKKKKKNFGANYGVDLNRNWGVRWADCAGAMGALPVVDLIRQTETYPPRRHFQNPKQANILGIYQNKKFCHF